MAGLDKDSMRGALARLQGDTAAGEVVLGVRGDKPGFLGVTVPIFLEVFLLSPPCLSPESH